VSFALHKVTHSALSPPVTPLELLLEELLLEELLLEELLAVVLDELLAVVLDELAPVEELVVLELVVLLVVLVLELPELELPELELPELELPLLELPELELPVDVPIEPSHTASWAPHWALMHSRQPGVEMKQLFVPPFMQKASAPHCVLSAQRSQVQVASVV
jgi:hypothetical protein